MWSCYEVYSLLTKSSFIYLLFICSFSFSFVVVHIAWFMHFPPPIALSCGGQLGWARNSASWTVRRTQARISSTLDIFISFSPFGKWGQMLWNNSNNNNATTIDNNNKSGIINKHVFSLQAFATNVGQLSKAPSVSESQHSLDYTCPLDDPPHPS